MRYNYDSINDIKVSVRKQALYFKHVNIKAGIVIKGVICQYKSMHYD